ncbi:PcfJ domain-containing protein [Flavobacterium sp. DGU11]|uniref:PcfJ domain-containing protein n=1 Tax=Flavobacterium arundinis TaxID=3139143 RepID=A0ABU9HY75_9FLAO
METQSTAIQIAARPGFREMVERLYAEQRPLQYGETTLEGFIRFQFASMDMMGESHKPKKDAFRILLLLMHTKKCYGVLRNPAFINVLVNVAWFEDKTVRPVAEWVKDSLTAEGQLASLIRHCFAKYEVPEFMEYTFAENSRIPMYYYIKLGRGDSVQALNIIPAGFTARMAHEFRNTPKQFTIVQAIRRAQALGCGATAARAEAVAWAHEFERFQNPVFTLAVIRFVAKVEENIPFDQLQQALEYLNEMYRTNNAYSFKGRTWASVTKRAAEYHAELARKRAAEQFSDWELCGVKDYEVEKENGIFRIIQLGTSEALYEEGREMSHCVADYAYDCTLGTVAIFSMRRFVPGDVGYVTLATIEVAIETAEIVQAKAKFNEMPCDEARAVMMDWAVAEKLTDGTFYEEEYVPPPPADVHYQGGQPVQQPVDYYRPYRPKNEISATEVVRIVLIIIKVLWILSKLR